MVKILGLLTALCLVAGESHAAVVNAANCGSSAVQSALNSASNGDTVLVSISGTATWTTAVTMPASKYVTLDLNGCTVTLSGASGEFTISAHASGHNRITNGAIVRGIGFNSYRGPFQIRDAPNSAAVRVDHITFSSLDGGVIVDINGSGPGLLDHVAFTGLGWAQEFIHIMGWGSGNQTGWTTSVDVGGPGLFYIEDSTFTTATGQNGVAWIQGFYGSRVVIRHNTFNHVSIDAHGTGGAVGQRWWEIYENTWQNSVLGSSGNWAMSMRAGSGVIFNNTDLDGRYNIGLCEEDSGYPAAYQIGRGINQTSDPAYVWGNDPGITLHPNSCDAPGVGGMVELNRDVFTMAKPGYTPYTYPHPLATGEELVAVPEAPSNLVVAP